jgi:hypothetical protein
MSAPRTVIGEKENGVIRMSINELMISKNAVAITMEERILRYGVM